MIEAAEGFEFLSTKTYGHSVGLSCAFRQWRAESHCHFLHGYALKIRFEFQATQTDVRNWVVDFGGMKSLKGTLEGFLDHKTIVARDDPHIEWFRQGDVLGTLELIELDHVGCEAMAQLIFEVASLWIIDAGYDDRVLLSLVEVAEHEGNSAIYRRTK